MNYEKIIVELLSRIQVLEEQVADLINKNDKNKAEGDNAMGIAEIKDYIERLKVQARESGESALVLRSGDIHKELNLEHRIPSVCKAMYQCMKLDDVILHTTPSGLSSTIEIEYKL